MAARLELYGVIDGLHLEHYEDDVLAAAQEGAPRPVEVQQGQAIRPATEDCPLFAGFVSASDDDEQALFDLLGTVAEHTGLDARQQGSGVVPLADAGDVFGRLNDLLAEANQARPVSATEITTSEGWLGALTMSTQLVATQQNALGWRMHYDRSGSTDDGPDEFPTAHS